MTPQLIYNQSIEESDIHNLCRDLEQYSAIEPKYYERFDVKRGLRNADGSGVIAGITRICNVHGYVMNEGERQPIPGQLIYRGYDINDLIENAEREDRYVFEEVVYLLLFGMLPDAKELEIMTRSLSARRELPPGFLVDSIMQSPSNNIMNKLARSILSLYSYSDITENTTIEDEMRIALDLIAKMPILMDGAYQAKRHKYDNASMIMHPLRPDENTAQSILSLIRNDRVYTKEEAQLLDVLLAIHADHGGGNNSPLPAVWRPLRAQIPLQRTPLPSTPSRAPATAAPTSRSSRCWTTSRRTSNTGRTRARWQTTSPRFSGRKQTTAPV